MNSYANDPSSSSYEPRTMKVLNNCAEAAREVGYLGKVLFTRVQGKEPSGEVDAENFDTRWPYPAVWIEGALPSNPAIKWGAVVEMTEYSGPSSLEERILAVYEKLAPADADESDGEKVDREHRIEEAIETGQSPQYLQTIRIYAPSILEDAFWVSFAHPLDSMGRILPALQVVHENPVLSEDGSDDRIFEILDCIQGWAGWYNQHAEDVPSFRQYPTIEPPQLSPDEIPPAWSRYFHQRFRRARPYLKQIEPSYSRMQGAVTMSSMQLTSAVAAEDWNHEMTRFERLARPRSMQAGFYETNHAHCYLGTRFHGNAIVRIPDSLVEEFYHTNVDEVCWSDVEWPYEAYYLSFRPPEPLFLGPGAEVDGAYVIKQGNETGGVEVFVLVTSRNKQIAYHRLPSYVCAQDPVFAMHFPIQDVTTTVLDSLAEGITEFYKETEPPERDETQIITNPDGSTRVIQDVRAASRAKRRDLFESQKSSFEKALRVIVNSMCFLSAYRHDAVSTWDDAPLELVAKAEAPATSSRTHMKVEAAKQKLDQLGYVKIQLCGVKAAELLEQVRPEAEGKASSTVRPHWRRGHWRRQRYGEHLSLIRLMWIRPVLVHASLGQPASGHLYEIE